MQTSIHKLGQWTALSLIVLVLINQVAIAGMFMSGVMPPGEPYLSVISVATLTSTNRYVSMTAVAQSIAMGVTDGLNWFMPYGWPSIMAGMEVLAWGFFLGSAFLFLAPVFRKGSLDTAIFWTLIISGTFSLIAVLGQVMNSVVLNMLGIIAWGPGLIILFVLFAFWFKSSRDAQSN